MNYLNIYISIIKKAQYRDVDKNITYEKHHIIPKCFIEWENPINLVLLTLREHYIVHLLLTKILPRKLGIWYAFYMMCTMKKYKVKNSRLYEEARKNYLNLKSQNVVSDETREKISNSKKGKTKGADNHFFGKTHDENTKLKMRKAKLGTKRNKETINKIKKSTTGVKKSEETIKKFSKSKSGDKNPMYGKTGSDHPKSKPVLQYSISGEFLREWINGTTACNTLNISYKAVNACCNGKTEISQGYRWKFKN